MDDVDLTMDICLENLKLEFGAGEDVTYVWEAVRYCVENKVTFPEWVLSYLLKSANSLLDIDTPKRESGKKVMEALGIHDIRVFSRKHRIKRIEDNFEAVRSARKTRSRGNRSEQIYEDVALRHGVSAGTVKKDFETQKKVVDENYQVLLEISREEGE